jgi:hypothetical protein
MSELADESRYPEDEYPWPHEDDQERRLAGAYVYEGLDVPDYGGTFDGFTVHSDADPGL